MQNRKQPFFNDMKGVDFMEITINIDNRPIRFKATGGIIYRYEAQFGRSIFEDLDLLYDFQSSRKLKKVKDTDGKTITRETYDFTKLSFNLMYNMAWVCAKTADESIPDPQVWLDSFNVFPIKDVIPKITNLITETLNIDPKN